MPQKIPEAFLDLLARPTFAHLATIMPDGTPQVTPAWSDFDGAHIIVNSARDRQKDCNMRRNPNVAVEIMDPENRYRYIQIRGKVVEITEEGGDDSIDSLAARMVVPEAKADWFKGLNRLDQGQPLQAGQLVKIVSY